MPAPLLLVVPSRGRPDRLPAMADAFQATATPGLSELLVVLDEDDPTREEYQPHPAVTYAVCPGPRRYMVPATNWAVDQNPGRTVYGSIGDDHFPTTPGWDDRILQALRVRPGVAYPNDLLQGENLATAGFLSGSVVAALGWLAPPTLQHLYCDNYWMNLGRGLDALTYLPDVIIEHRHYHVGKSELDATYQEANAPEQYDRDREALDAHMRARFQDDLTRIRARSITLIVMTDGRPCLPAAIESLEQRLTGLILQRVIHDDTGDPAHRADLAARFPSWGIAGPPHRLGLDGAYRHAWEHLRRHTSSPWIFSSEDDFLIDRDVNLDAMIDVLAARPDLIQMALRRQPWSGPEIEHGGYIGLAPDAYQDRPHWLEHRQFWTNNPALYPRTILDRFDWPTGEKSEAALAAAVFTDPAARAGIWGTREDAPWITHTGADRHPLAKGY